MAAEVNGTAHVWGIPNGVGGIPNATVVSDNTEEGTRNNAETVNETGNKIEDRRDDKEITGSLTLRIRTSFVVAAAATKITYDRGDGDKTYLITSVGRANQAQGFCEITYNILWNEYCSYED